MQPDPKNGSSRCCLWLVAGCVLVLLVAVLMPSPTPNQAANPAALASSPSSAGSGGAASDGWTIVRDYKPRSAQEIVAEKVRRFGAKRRALVHSLAEHYKIEVLPDVERFFDALDAGDWDETDRLFKSLKQERENSCCDLQKYWRAILEADGAAEQVHLWPPQQLLDYGNGVLDALKPGVAYLGGTDSGCFIVTMLNETGAGEEHLTLTQNALADSSYLDYLSAIYGDNLNVPTHEDAENAFNQYLNDAGQRALHDEQFPDEPKQLQPGEDVSVVDGKTTISGQVAVMAINNLLTQMLLQKNPDLSFGLEESFPLSSTYPGAAPLGPIFALNTGNTMTADQASQSVNYWQNEAQQLQAGGETSTPVLQSFSHDASAQGNLLANNNFPEEASQAYQTALNICPSNPEAISGLTRVLAQQGLFEQASQAFDNFLQANPQESQTVNNLRQTWLPGH